MSKKPPFNKSQFQNLIAPGLSASVTKALADAAFNDMMDALMYGLGASYAVSFDSEAPEKAYAALRDKLEESIKRENACVSRASRSTRRRLTSRRYFVN